MSNNSIRNHQFGYIWLESVIWFAPCYFLATMLKFASSVSAQLLPGDLDVYDDDAEIKFRGHQNGDNNLRSRKSGNISRKVSIQVESGELANAAPGSMIIAQEMLLDFKYH